MGCDDLKARTEAFGFPVFVADGADFFAVHEAAGKAIARAPATAPPAFLQARPLPRYLLATHRHGSEAAKICERTLPKNFRAHGRSDELSEAEMNAIDAEVMAETDNLCQTPRPPRPPGAGHGRRLHPIHRRPKGENHA